ncbi:hypothetical protein [Streptomyces sp. CA-106110]|uniref:hypothetical protein n=1 Tax=Streptomyces sp. CA-106110 TaxID=3240044 RepID=UPI003D93409C
MQFIGGEPTRHPDFDHLLRHTLGEGLDVQVFSNLFRVRPKWWKLFADSRASVGTSHYSDDLVGLG